MPKKFKMKSYEKTDNDDHYVVVLNPWNRGLTQPSQEQADYIGAWLRIAFHHPTNRNAVISIYSKKTRSEIIARISSFVDIKIGLGLHKWGELMTPEYLHKVRRQNVDLTRNISYIFNYNWIHRGDPAENQWHEWFPDQFEIPKDVMIKWNYPEPEWTEIPKVDGYLRSLLVPMPRGKYLSDGPKPGRQFTDDVNRGTSTVEGHAPEQLPEEPTILNANERVDEEGRRSRLNPNVPERTGDSATVFSLYQRPLHLQQNDFRSSLSRSGDIGSETRGASKMKKLDPHEEDDVARASLHASLHAVSVKREMPNGIKGEVEDTKSNIRDVSEEYRPSNALSSVISQLQSSRDSSESEDHEPAVKAEEIVLNDRVKSEEDDVKPNIHDSSYHPSASLARAISQLHSETTSQEPEDRKPIIKEEKEYSPSNALRDAFSRYSETHSADLNRNRTPKRSRQGDHAARRGSSGGRPRASALQGSKRIKVETHPS